MKKLLICQFYTPNLEYGVLAEEVNRRYCSAFDIDYFSQTDKAIIDKVRDNRAYTWYKIPMLLELLNTDEYEYVMYMDADAVFVRDNYNIVDIIEEHLEYDFICSGDFGPDVVNGGVLIFKNSDWSKNFLQRVWDSANYVSRGRYKTEIWHEQTILSAFMLINQEDRSKTKIMSHYDDNAINDHILRANKTLIYHDLSKIRIQEIHKLGTGNYDINTELNLTCNSDRHVGHGYARFYYETIEELLKTQDEVSILDIGGDRGVLFDVFLKYYPNLSYTNITNEQYTPDNKNINQVLLEDINRETLSSFLNSNDSKYDIIISDFRHSCQIRDLIFSLFFDRVAPGGVYVVEDLQTDLEIAIPQKNAQYGWGDPTKKSMTQLIEQFNIDGSFDSDYENFKDLNEDIEKAEIFKAVPFSSLLGLIYKK